MSMHLFDASLYDFDRPQPSYWEATRGTLAPSGQALVTAERCDVAIIGGGYTGLSAAYHLARDYQLDVRVLEAGHIGWGASGRNGGFCTMGCTKLSLDQQLKKFGLDETRHFYRRQAEAVRLVRELGQSESIDYLAQGDGEYVVADSPAHHRKLSEQAAFQRQQLDMDVSMLSADAFAKTGYRSSHQHGALHIRPTFGLHPLRYVLGLGHAAEKHGAVLHPHSEVLDWERQGASHRLRTRGGELLADRVILAGNGFMPEHLCAGIRHRPLPAQSAIVVTRPLSEEELATQGWQTESPMINSSRVFFYYRLLSDRRLMLGGRADATGRPDRALRSWSLLQQQIAAFWPGFGEAEITHSWRGLVCLTGSLCPSIGVLQDDESVFYSYGYQGNGVASATWQGRALARWIGEGSARQGPPSGQLPALLLGEAPRLPLAFLRRQYVAAGQAWYRLRDRLERTA